jgi:hypothetical protein
MAGFNFRMPADWLRFGEEAKIFRRFVESVDRDGVLSDLTAGNIA